MSANFFSDWVEANCKSCTRHSNPNPFRHNCFREVAPGISTGVKIDYSFIMAHRTKHGLCDMQIRKEG